MEIRTLTENSDRLSVHLCGNDAVLIQGKELKAVQTNAGILVVSGNAKEILNNLGLERV